MIQISQTKILVVIGPTSSGKSELAVRLAKQLNGEIISCDSRQIYKGMDLGTGKVDGQWKKLNTAQNDGRHFYKHFYYEGVTHHLIDFVNPKKQYSAALFQRDAHKVITDIASRGKLPILCGGTAHWMNAVVYNQLLPGVKPNKKLRKQLEKLSTDGLFKRINRLDPQRAKLIDRHNRRRLIRALEIVILTGKPVPPLSAIRCPLSAYDSLWLGIYPTQNLLFSKIKKRLRQRLKAGMVNEVKLLHRQGLSYKRLESFGLEYKFLGLYLQKKLNSDEMFEQLFAAIKKYSKRQMTWWKRNKEINWINDYSEAQKLTKKFLV